MGYTVLYIAFGVVALWLFGEVLLQYKARLRWRVLAFAGFMGVVAGLALREVIVIALGAATFAIGQTFVTLSYRRGFSTGWSIGGRPGSSRRRREGGAAAVSEPTLQVSPIEPVAEPGAMGFGALDGVDGVDETSVFEPQPLHDDAGEYGIYSNESSYTPDPYTSGGYEGYGAEGYGSQSYGEGTWGEHQPAAASYDAHSSGYNGYNGYGGWDTSRPVYGTDGTHGAGTEQPASYGYEGQYGQDTPVGGVWVPQQASAPTDDQPFIPQQSQQPSYEQPQLERSQYADPYDPYR